MFPKSTASLKQGDYCLVPRDDGLFVPFVYVGRRGSDRSYFFGALADAVVRSSEDMPERIVLLEHALLHIKCYVENNTPILGNLSSRLDGGAMVEIISDIHRSGVGHTTRVWGHRTVIKLANGVKAQHAVAGDARNART